MERAAVCMFRGGSEAMPTERFLKLPEEKRRRILEAAFDNFCRCPASKVSINSIIREAGISRGSF